jgi:hypothetical protein
MDGLRERMKGEKKGIGAKVESQRPDLMMMDFCLLRFFWNQPLASKSPSLALDVASIRTRCWESGLEGRLYIIPRRNGAHLLVICIVRGGDGAGDGLVANSLIFLAHLFCRIDVWTRFSQIERFFD